MILYIKKMHKLTFSILGLGEKLLSNLKNLNISQPSPVQRALLPVYSTNSDLILKNSTGSGKTLGLCICSVNKLASRPNPFHTRNTIHLAEKQSILTLFVVPTRELALQIQDWIRRLDSEVHVASVYRGPNPEYQEAEISKIPKILIGTPNRLLELYNQNRIDLSGLKTVILDEFDRMVPVLSKYASVKQRFNRKIHPLPAEILMDLLIASRKPLKKDSSSRAIKEKLQVVVTSATISNRTRGYLKGKGWLTEPVILDLQYSTIENTKHNGYYISASQELLPITSSTELSDFDGTFDNLEVVAEGIAKLFHDYQAKKVFVFVPSDLSISELVRLLNVLGLKAARLYDMNDFEGAQSTPFKALIDGSVNIVCASEGEARGLDVTGIDMVIMLGVSDPQSYIHSSGRTGRFGASGTAITILPSPFRIPKYLQILKQLEIHAEGFPND